ncbi:FadR/GntR family transcriptional regulator [Nakamurella sp. A5-74]|uniref:FadR/GntR family transcriptional regulator n=1 Tax=Nakamurella sp. A5-74 TaxID=3158264 RepID=A0AAU8DN47_9ACTN
MTQLASRVSPAQRGPRHPRKDSVVELIKAYIVRNQLRPGDSMPNELELCAELDVSRGSLREAIKTLSALDIVEVRHGFGTYVGSMSFSALVESLAFRSLLSSADDQRVLLDLVEVRQMLEQGLADGIIRAAASGTLSDELRTIANAMATKASAGEEFLEEDRQFHLLLMEPLGNDLIGQLTGAFWDVFAIVAPVLGPVDDDLQTTARAHAQIVDAAAAGDLEQLLQAISNHYEPIRRRVHALSDLRRRSEV